VDAAAAEAVTDQVRALTNLGVEALRKEWRLRYGAPPALRSSDHLRRLLAWRMQAEVFGGFDAETRQALLRKPPAPKGPKLKAGARLAREWQGRTYEVEVLERGVRYGERTYASLSEVAREITGVRWNGPRFFGLRAQARR
jgi:hypothetical protein